MVGDQAFEVEINDGRVFTIPADKTIVEVLEDPNSKPAGLLKKAFGGAAIVKGEALDAMMASDYKAAGELLDAVSN